MNWNDESTDRRTHPRKKVFKPAQIVYQNGTCVMDCVVADLSEGGVRLKHTDIFGCPDLFELRMKNEPFHRCNVVQKSEHWVGAKFLD